MNTSNNKKNSSFLSFFNKNNNNNKNKIYNNNNNNVINKITNDDNELSFATILIILIILILIGAGAYWVYSKYWSMTTTMKINQVDIIKDVRDATTKASIGSGLIPTSSYSNEYSISFWMNIDNYDYNYGKEKVIMRRGPAGAGNPEILLDAKNNDLIVRVRLQQGTTPTAIAGQLSTGQQRATFQDIPIGIPGKMGCGGPVITKDEPYYTYDRFEPSGNVPLTGCKHVDSSKVGCNDVDYPTITYVKPSKFEDDYFALVSGNAVQNPTKEGFTPQDDATAAIAKVLLDICDIATVLQSKTLAATSADQMKAFFDMILDGLDKVADDAKNMNDIATAYSTTIEKLPNQEVNSELLKKVEILSKDVKELEKYNNVQLNITTIKSVINDKLKAANCPLTIDGTTEVDNTISFAKNVVKLIRNSLFAYITNLGDSFRGSAEQTCTSTEMASSNTNNCMVKMIPLQKWVNVIVSVYNQVVDIYVDGQLANSCVLSGFPDISTETVEIAPEGGFAGKIAKVSFSNSAMTMGDARTIYNAGPMEVETIFQTIPPWAWYIAIAIVVLLIVYSILA